jgi:hypothetical protein
MKCLTIIAFLTISVCTFGQTVRHEGFRLAVILPDTTIIDGKLLEYARAVESDHIKDYYRTVKNMEDQLESWESRDSLHRFPMMRRTIQKRLDSLKTLEQEVTQYKYFYKLADYSLYHFKLTCGETSSANNFLVIATKTPSKKNFKEISEKFNLNYLVRYTDIKAITTDKGYEMKLIATLYSKNLKLLLKDEFIATSKCQDDRLRCVTPLCCMLTNITKSSATKICETVERLQKKVITAYNTVFMPAAGDVLLYSLVFLKFISVTWDKDALRKPQPS